MKEMDGRSAPVFGRDGGQDGEMEKMGEIGSVMMNGRDDGMESKMCYGKREVRWREDGDGLERKRAQRWVLDGGSARDERD